MNLTIPDDILTASEMSEAELKLEIAIVLYIGCRRLSS
jgi:predicted HTH domain antitoxin